MTGTRRLAVLANLEKAGVNQLYTRLEKWAGSNGFELVSNLDGFGTLGQSGSPFGGFDADTLAKRFTGSEVLITLGGDGTLLYAAQVAAPDQMPILSVNLGSLGFHTQASPDNLDQCLPQIAAKTYLVERRMILSAAFQSGKKDESEIQALNDFVISKSAWGHMITLHIRIDDETVTDVSADALIVSSPTGSSAYNYAAGGPVLYPDMDAIVLNALCAHRMRVSPLVVPGGAQITVSLKPRRQGESAQILNDGQPWEAISEGEVLKISRSGMYLPLIVFENDFYGKLRDKLRWGGLL